MTQLLDFRNLKDLMRCLSDETVCRHYMEKMRWGDQPFCPHCNSTKPYRLKDGKNFRCSSLACKKDFSVLVKTVFENSKVKLSTWLAAMYILSAHKKGISSIQLGKNLGVTQKTAWFILHRLRFIMFDNKPLLLENIVEVDETYVGGKLPLMSRGRRKRIIESGKDNKAAVMGLLERDGKAKLTVIGKSSFKDVVRQNVSKEAFVMTDSHAGYIGLAQEFAGHDSVNHSQLEFKRGNTHTNSIEGFFSVFKRTIFGTYHAVSPKHLEQYCAETAYRFNFRHMNDADRFRMAISNIEGRLKYKDLIQKNKHGK